jgi:RHS repeat-associated protein
MRTVVKAIDEFGRPPQIVFENDTALTEDDVCLDLTYPINIVDNPSVDPTVLDVVHTERWSDCENRTLAEFRYLYDSDAEGEVSTGLQTHRFVTRYNTSTGIAIHSEDEIDHREYDDFGNVTAVNLSRPSDGDTRRTEYSYDAFNLAPIEAFDQADDLPGTTLLEPQQTFVEYDPISMLPIRITDPTSAVHTAYYDAFGRPILDGIKSDPDATEYVLHELIYHDKDESGLPLGGRALTERIFHDWTPLDSYRIDPDAYLDRITATTAYIDGFGRMLYRETPLGSDYGYATVVTNFTQYDPSGRVSFVADPYVTTSNPPFDLYGTSYHYYPDARLRCMTRGQGPQRLAPYTSDPSVDLYPTCFDYSYDNYQLVVRSRGPNDLPAAPTGNFDETRFSAIGRRLSQTRLSGSTPLEQAKFSYDGLGNVTNVIRASNPASSGAPAVAWSFDYDSFGHLLRIDGPGLARQERHYDEWGQLVYSTWSDTSVSPPTEQFEEHSYDGFGRPVEVSFGDASLVPPPTHYTYCYDEPPTDPTDPCYEDATGDPDHPSTQDLIGRLASYHDSRTSTSLRYDTLGRADTFSRVFADDGRRVSVRQDFTPSGQLQTLSFSMPDASIPSESAHYEFDSARRVTGISLDSGTSLFDATAIDPFGRYLSVRFGTDAVEAFDFRPDHRRELLTQTLTTPADTTTTTYTGYDGDGRLQGRETTTSSGTWSTLYTYDATHRLAGASSVASSPSGSLTDSEGFTYDALGNLTHLTAAPGDNARVFTTSTEDPDRLCNELKPGEPIPADCGYQYDVLGNVTSIRDAEGAVRTFTYDARSRLIGLQRGSTEGEISYDALNEPLAGTVQDTGTSAMRTERRFGSLVREVVDSEGGTGTSRMVEWRIPGPLGIVATRRTNGGAPFTIYWHGDFSANRTFTGDDGSIIQDVDYRPYGGIRSDTGDETASSYTDELWNFGKTLKAFDIVLLGVRAYDPDSGRFLQRDPLLSLAGAGRSNPYAFAGGDPVNSADPRGLDPIIIVGGPDPGPGPGGPNPGPTGCQGEGCIDPWTTVKVIGRAIGRAVCWLFCGSNSSQTTAIPEGFDETLNPSGPPNFSAAPANLPAAVYQPIDSPSEARVRSAFQSMDEDAFVDWAKETQLFTTNEELYWKYVVPITDRNMPKILPGYLTIGEQLAQGEAIANAGPIGITGMVIRGIQYRNADPDRFVEETARIAAETQAFDTALGAGASLGPGSPYLPVPGQGLTPSIDPVLSTPPSQRLPGTSPRDIYRSPPRPGR